MEEVVLSIIVIIIFAVVQQASSTKSAHYCSKAFAVPQFPQQYAPDISTENDYEDNPIVDMSPDHEVRILDTFQKNIEGKRELLVYELREIAAQYDTTTFFEKYPDVHKYIFNIP